MHGLGSRRARQGEEKLLARAEEELQKSFQLLLTTMYMAPCRNCRCASGLSSLEEVRGKGCCCRGSTSGKGALHVPTRANSAEPYPRQEK